VHRLAGFRFAWFQPTVLGQVTFVDRADVSLEVIDAKEAHPAAERREELAEFVGREMGMEQEAEDAITVIRPLVLGRAYGTYLSLPLHAMSGHGES